MKTKLILLNLTLLLTVLLQPCAARAADGTPVWTNYFNGSADKSDNGDAIVVDAMGNAYVTGTSGAANNTPDILTMKFSADGQPAWTNIFSGTVNYNDYGNAIALDPDGNVYVAGTTTATNLYYDFVTIKFSNDGVPLWTNYFNGPGNEDDELYSMAVDGSGNVYVTGYMTDGTGGYAYATIKYTTAGVPLWTNVFTDPVGDEATANAIALDSATNVYVTGYSYSPATKNDYVTIKYSTDGVPLWTNFFNGPSTSDDFAVALAVDGGGNAVVAGYATTASGYDWATIKYSTTGTPLWTNYFNGTANGSDYPNAVALNDGGDAFVTGRALSAGAGYDFVTIKYASDGTPAWTNLFNGTANSADTGVAVAVDGDGNAIVTGNTTSSGSGSDILTIKYAGDGTPVWTNLLSSPGAATDGGNAIAVDANGNACVAGTVATGNNDLVVVKYSGPMPIEPPTVLSIVPETLHVSQYSNDVSLVVTFSKPVTNFNDYLDIIVNATNFDDNFSEYVLTPGPTNIYTITISNFRVTDGVTNATLAVQVATNSDVTDLNGTPLASSVESPVIQVSANSYQLWALDHGLTAGANFGYTNDPDMDGNNNATEFMRGTDPLSGGDVVNRRVMIYAIGGTNYLTCTMPVPKGFQFSSIGAYSLFSDPTRGILAQDELLGTDNLTSGFPGGGVECREVIPALDGPVAGQPDLPVLPDTHVYRTVRLSVGTESLPQGFLLWKSLPFPLFP